MLLQSHAGELHVLPALPAEFAAGSVSGLVARPGITVDIRWEHGAAVELSMTPRNAAAAGMHLARIGEWTGFVELRTGYRTRLVASGPEFKVTFSAAARLQRPQQHQRPIPRRSR